ncbi:hypothetical protein H2248_010182 [Termitomyces sp. 'cryptogamus']|nr:hypothetical protein H2248_010182 [Termitomyces sp. 'cryptogamus']
MKKAPASCKFPEGWGMLELDKKCRRKTSEEQTIARSLRFVVEQNRDRGSWFRLEEKSGIYLSMTVSNSSPGGRLCNVCRRSLNSSARVTSKLKHNESISGLMR